MRYLGLLAITITVGAAPAVWALEDSPASGYGAIDSIGGGAIPALPLTEHTNGDIRYISGGIGDEELAELKARGSEFSLHVLLSAPRGEYISDTQLRVLGEKDVEVLSVNNAGPYVYATLKPGEYTVEATNGHGETKKVKITIPAKGSAKAHIVLNETV